MRNRVLAVAVVTAAFFAIAGAPSSAGKPGGGGTISNPAYAYTTQVKGNQPKELFIATFDGSSKKQLTSDNFTEHLSPTWSPDGAKIAYLAAGSSGGYAIDGIYVVNADGSGTPTRIHETNVGGELTWSPDGATIAHSDKFDDIVLVDVATGDTTFSFVSDGYVREIAWSLDSSTIVFSGTPDRGPELNDLFLLDVATGTVTNLTNTPQIDEWEPTWSSDGRIAFLIDEDARRAVWVMDEDGTNASQIVAAQSGGDARTDLRWSPDAAYLSYIEELALYRVLVSTGQVTKVLTSKFGIGSADWNPAWQ